jgi:hypothetical protein
MSKRLQPNVLALLLMLAAPVVPVVAESPKPITSNDTLLRTMESLDGAVFDAYNRCDLDKFGGYFSSDVEFYHDKGAVTLVRQSLVESIKKVHLREGASRACRRDARRLSHGRLWCRRDGSASIL